MDVGDMKVSDEDGLLFLNVKIKANSAIMKERIWLNRVTNEIVFQTVALRCTLSVSLQFERSRFRILNSATEMSQVDCCHPGNSQVSSSHRFCRSGSKLRRNLRTRRRLLFGGVSTLLPLRTSAAMRRGWLVHRGWAARRHARRTIRLLTAMDTSKSGIRRMEELSTFPSGSESGRLFVDISLMVVLPGGAQLVCAVIRSRSRCTKGKCTSSASQNQTRQFCWVCLSSSPGNLMVQPLETFKNVSDVKMQTRIDFLVFSFVSLPDEIEASGSLVSLNFSCFLVLGLSLQLEWSHARFESYHRLDVVVCRSVF